MNFTRSSIMLAALFATLATALVVFIFSLSRGDHDMKLLALGAVISQASALMSTASTMLVGKDKRDASDAPEGSKVTETSTVQLPPIPAA